MVKIKQATQSRVKAPIQKKAGESRSYPWDDEYPWIDDHSEDEYSIYSLRYPIRHSLRLKVFYVGIALDPYKRFVQHLSTDGSNEEKDTVIRTLKESFHPPIMEIEATARGKELAERLEAFFIEYYRAAMHPLVNKVLPLSQDANFGRYMYEDEQFVLEWYANSHKRFAFLKKLIGIIDCIFLQKEERKRWHEKEKELLLEYRLITHTRSLTSDISSRNHCPSLVPLTDVSTERETV